MIKLAIAEDNLSLANVVKEELSFFEDVKIKFVAENGGILLKKLEQDSNVDLIFMDIQMPKMDGIQVVELVKNKYPQIKILVLTVFDDEINIFNAIKAGAVRKHIENGYSKLHVHTKFEAIEKVKKTN